MLKVGLTGNIASGKSIVQSYFEKKGIPVIDADWICHRLMDNNAEVIEKVKKLFEASVELADVSSSEEEWYEALKDRALHWLD